MSTANPALPGARSILWIAVLLLLATIGAHLRVTVCTGGCGIAAESAAQSCCASEAAPDASCCSCCAAGILHPTLAADPAEEPGGDTLRGSCQPDCCVSIAFDVELAPVPTKVEAPTGAAVVFAGSSAAWRAPDARPLAGGRPFDRGPPRVDRLATLRACTVLLI